MARMNCIFHGNMTEFVLIKLKKEAKNNETGHLYDFLLTVSSITVIAR